MKIFLFGQKLKPEDLTHIQSLLTKLKEERAQVWIYEPFLEQLEIGNFNTWSSEKDIEKEKPNFFITLGGDGTILQAICHIRHHQIPILGINLGRLGFLASTEKKLISDAIHQLMKGMYEIEDRTLLQLESNPALFGEVPIALNDFTILKRDNSSMITIHTFINGDFLNSYWADGLIVATPTGSTGYSLSCGGPIIFPNSNNLVITPVAPHNLNVRPVVIPDSSILSFEVEGRTDNFLCTLDSRYEVITQHHQIAVRKCEFKVKLVQLQPVSFLKTIHEKLHWGLDQRN
jgi:NAD+ kinase